MSETISFLIGPLTAITASVIFFWLARRETNKTAVLVEQMKENFHSQVEGQIRRLQEASTEACDVPLPDDVKESAADFVREAFQLLDKQSKEVAEELAEFNEHNKRAKERIESGIRRTQGSAV